MNPITINASNFLKGFSLSANVSGGFSPESLGFETDRYADLGLLKAGRSKDDFSTNIADYVYSSFLYYRNSNLYYYSIGSAGKIYETTVVANTPAHTVKYTESVKSYSANSSVLVYNGGLFISSATDIYYDDFTFTVNDNDWWTSTKSKTALTSGVPHKLFEFQGVMFITNGNKLASWDGSVAKDASLTLPAGWIITDVLVDGSIMYITASFSGTNNWYNLDSKIFVWDGYSDSWLREVSIDAPGISAITKAENGYIFFAGRGVFYFDGASYSWLRGLVVSGLPNFNQVKSFDGKIFFVANGKGIYCYNTRLKSFTCPVSEGNTINCINIGYLDYLDIWCYMGTNNSWKFFRCKDNTATNTFYSDLYDLGNGYVDKVEILFSSKLPTNATYTLRVLDEAGDTLKEIIYNNTGKIKIVEKADVKTSVFSISLYFGHSACVPVRHIKIYGRPSEQNSTK